MPRARRVREAGSGVTARSMEEVLGTEIVMVAGSVKPIQERVRVVDQREVVGMAVRVSEVVPVMWVVSAEAVPEAMRAGSLSMRVVRFQSTDPLERPRVKS